MRSLVLLAALTALIVSTLPANAERREAKPTWQARKLAQVRAERDALRREVRVLRRQLAHRPSVREAIRLASIAYGVPYREMVAVAWCESRLSARAKNPRSTASSVFQILTSTFRNTPYRNEAIFSPYANSLAAGYIWRADGGSWRQWVCRP